jgi:hypothetical protein
MYGGVGFASSGGFNPALPPNNSLKATCYPGDLQPRLAGNVGSK